MALIDWDAATAEATALLQAYLRIDTSNPPGNEALAVDFLAGVLRAEGVAFETAEPAPGRSNLIARLGPPGGLCLLNHTDVVPVERQYWDRDPFAAEIEDGFIYGRGTLDMKGMGIIELMTFLLLKRQGLDLRKGVTFLAAADEETGSSMGVGWLADHRPGWLDAEVVINEGACGVTGIPETDLPIFGFASSEKIPVWVRLTVKGRPGHGSVPHGDNCADHLVAALGRVAAWAQNARVTPLVRAHMVAMREAGAVRWKTDQDILQLAIHSPVIRARVQNTVVLTTMQSGIKTNVIPAEATATLDCRLLPDVDVDEFLAGLRAAIADQRVEMEVLNRFQGAESPLNVEVGDVIREVLSDLSEGARLVPELSSGFTDSRIYRARGIPAYGFVPCLVHREDLAGIHGHNERISIENLRLGMQVLYEVVRRYCATP